MDPLSKSEMSSSKRPREGLYALVGVTIVNARGDLRGM